MLNWKKIFRLFYLCHFIRKYYYKKRNLGFLNSYNLSLIHKHTLNQNSPNLLPFPAKSASNVMKRIMPSFFIVLQFLPLRLCWWHCWWFIYSSEANGRSPVELDKLQIFILYLKIRKTDYSLEKLLAWKFTRVCYWFMLVLNMYVKKS